MAGISHFRVYKEFTCGPTTRYKVFPIKKKGCGSPGGSRKMVNDMRYIRPEYYDAFKCTADKCPDTCCTGWQIMIDEDSLERYQNVRGAFGCRLHNSIDWQEGAFCQYEGRCAFLDEQNLCDIYAEMGSDALCDTCRRYPRHVEEYEGLREWSLSLSCPVAAEMILSEQPFPTFLVEEDEEDDELQDEFEDFDLLLFTQLEDARAVVMDHLKKSDASLENKLCLYLQFADEMQECIDREEYYEIDNIIRGYTEFSAKGWKNKSPQSEKKTRFMQRKALCQHMLELERLRSSWSGVLLHLEDTLYAKGHEHYNHCVERFESYLRENPAAWKQWEQVGLRLFVFFLYTYFCGAVYDDWIYSKMALAVESVRFLRELYMAEWIENGRLDRQLYVELAYRYAREIEHSDFNLNKLEEIFMEKYSKKS